MIEYMVLGLFFAAIGAFTVLMPGVWIKMEVWHKRKFWGATLTPTPKSYRYMRTLGALFLILGLVIVLRGYFEV